jgi:hypothetical protein
VFGSIKIGGKHSPHAYAALMDSNFLDSKRSTACLPTIVFEATARIGGSWTDNTQEQQTSHEVHTAVLKSFRNPAGWARMMRSEASVPMIRENEIYGPVSALITGDHRGKRQARHWVACSKAGMAGVPADQLFGHDKDLKLVTVASYQDADSSDFQQLCNELPRLTFPTSADAKTCRTPL